MNYMKKEIVVIGLGYVGLPLAINLSKNYNIIGFDIDIERVNDLKKNNDRTKEVSSNALRSASHLSFTNDLSDIFKKYIYIITVHTPVNQKKLPNLKYVKQACKIVGKSMAKKAIVILLNKFLAFTLNS